MPANKSVDVSGDKSNGGACMFIGTG